MGYIYQKEYSSRESFSPDVLTLLFHTSCFGARRKPGLPHRAFGEDYVASREEDEQVPGAEKCQPFFDGKCWLIRLTV